MDIFGSNKTRLMKEAKVQYAAENMRLPNLALMRM
jgi:hypothetical protein